MKLIFNQLRNALNNVVFPEILFRLRTLIFGKVSSTELYSMLEKNLSYSQLTRWESLKKRAYLSEFSHLISSWDAFIMREFDDPFIDSPIIEKYRQEFEEFACQQTYQPAGMINTELLLLYALIRHVKLRVFIESGTKNAYSAVFIAEALKKNNVKNARLYCLSLFEEDEYQLAQQRLSSYPFVTIKQGYSEQLVNEIGEKYGKERVGILIDGPKARSESWDILIDRIFHYFPNLLFLCFDSAQEHVPYYSQFWGQPFDLERSINMERAKMLYNYEKKFKPRNYKIVIQSNQFCHKYAYLNERIYQYRNERWGKFFPWDPYKVDRMDHVAHSYKMAVIYDPAILGMKFTMNNQI